MPNRMRVNQTAHNINRADAREIIQIKILFNLNKLGCI